MATNIAPTSDSIVPRIVTIVDDHDLTLRVTQYTMPLKASEDGRDKIKAIVDFQVTRQHLVDSSESDFIQHLLTTRNFAEAGKKTIDLYEQDPLAVEVILCAIYHKDEAWRSSDLGQEVTARTLNLHWKDLWEVVISNRFLMIEFFNLDTWFSLWYEKNGKEHDSELLYPCFQFNHADGFLCITKNLVYDQAHIEEYRHEKYPDLHVPPRVINALNAARGHLRVLLARWLWKPLDLMMAAECDCKEKTVYQYLRALVETRGYPVDQQGRKSVDDICQSLEKFDLSDTRGDCLMCSNNWNSIVTSAVREVKKHFDGMCLDCMDATQPKFLDEHMDYWSHAASKEWDKKCRVSHGQATWYSSFMGRADTRDWLLKRVRTRKRTYSSI